MAELLPAPIKMLSQKVLMTVCYS